MNDTVVRIYTPIHRLCGKKGVIESHIKGRAGVRGRVAILDRRTSDRYGGKTSISMHVFSHRNARVRQAFIQCLPLETSGKSTSVSATWLK